MLETRLISRTMVVRGPVIVQVTVVLSAPWGSRLKTVVLSDLKGLRNCRATSTREAGTTSVISIRPAPAFRLPDHS